MRAYPSNSLSGHIIGDSRNQPLSGSMAVEPCTLESLAQRLTLLEAQNRRLRFGAAAATLLFACASILAANGGRHSRRIEAEQFVVKDSAGRVLASLGVNRDGRPELALRDDRGNDQILLGVNQDESSSLEFLNRGRLQTHLSSSTDSGPALQLFNANGRLVTSLYAWNNGETGLALNRENGGLTLGVEKDGNASFNFADPDGLVRSGWRFHTDGQLLAHHPSHNSEPAQSEQFQTQPASLSPIPVSFVPFTLGVRPNPTAFVHSSALLP